MDPLVTPATVVGEAADTPGGSLQEVAVTVLPIAAVIVAIGLGWRFARRFIKG